MTILVEELTASDIEQLVNGSAFIVDRYRQIQATNAQLTTMLEGAVVPTFSALKHQQYFDTVTSKYYRNTDGGTTWVALN